MKLKLLLLFTIGFFSCFVYSQKVESIKKEEITVKKSFVPKIPAAKKIKSKIIISDTLTSKIESPKIFISSVAVASTFDPSKGTPKKLEIVPTKESFNSRLALGFGNFNNLLLDYGSSISLDKRQNVDWFLFYDGLLKNINDFSIDTKQSNFNLNISHQFSTSKRNSFSQINFRQHRQSFYGLPVAIEDNYVLSNFDPVQRLTYFSITSDWKWYDKIVKGFSLNSYYTADSYSTRENEISFSSKFQLDFGAIYLTAIPKINILSTNFKEDFYTRMESELFSSFGGVSIYSSKEKGRFKFRLGIQSYFITGDEYAEKNLYYFPDVNITFKPENSNFAPFLNLNGEFYQNSFRTLSHVNPYIAPAVRLRSSFSPHKIELGTRSSLSKGWEFQWNLFYLSEENRPMFRNFGKNFDVNNIIAYRFGNSFEVLYTSLLSTGIKTKLKGVFKNGGRLNFEAAYFNYDLRNKTPELFEALNLPEISLQFDSTLKISNKIYFQLFLKYVGVRTNSFRDIFLGQDIENSPILFETLDPFTQIDANIQYNLNDRWEVFIRGKNLLNQNQFFWSNYTVYPLQISLGLKYNFDVSF
tara:strand:- start:15632 stop:17383 length:1752 start_codon:yes stop_codon:yes gene_type:complete